MTPMSEDESYPVIPRDVGEIVRTADKDGLTELFERPVGAIVESITGWLAAGPKVWALATGRIVQGALKGKLFEQVAREISELQAKGKIADDFAERKYGFQTWVELLTAIDEDTPDEDRLDAMKAMFLACNKVNATDAEQILGYQLFQIAKRLTSNDLLVLKAIYELHLKGRISPATSTRYSDWAHDVANHLGHYLRALVEHAESALVSNQLLSSRVGQGGETVNPTNGRLTDLGLKFCENIERYHIEKKSP